MEEGNLLTKLLNLVAKDKIEVNCTNHVMGVFKIIVSKNQNITQGEWELKVFYDNGVFDYIKRIITPDGEVYWYEEYPKSEEEKYIPRLEGEKINWQFDEVLKRELKKEKERYNNSNTEINQISDLLEKTCHCGSSFKLLDKDEINLNGEMIKVGYCTGCQVPLYISVKKYNDLFSE